MNLTELKTTNVTHLNHRRFGEIVRCLVAGILLAAASMKAAQLYDDVAAIETMTLAWAGLHIGFEVALALLVISTYWRRGSWVISLVSFAVFGVISLNKALHGDASCGCFGDANVDPWLTFNLDVAIVVLMLLSPRVWTRHDSRGAAQSSAWKRLAYSGCVATAGWLLVGFASAEKLTDGVRQFKADEWTGKPLPFVNDIEISMPLTRGQWNVLFYDPDCSKCQEVIDSLWGQAGNTALISMHPMVIGSHKTTHPARWFVGTLRDESSWFIATPTLIRINDGILQPGAFLNSSDS